MTVILTLVIDCDGLSPNLSTISYFKVHPWVNYDQILQKCFIGRLVATDRVQIVDDLFDRPSTSPKFGSQRSATKQSIRSTVPKESQSSAIESKDSSTEVKSSPKESSDTSEKSPASAESSKVARSSNDVAKELVETLSSRIPLLPRFDWIQKLDSISVIFYTRAFSNPMVEIYPPNADKAIKVSLTYDDTIFQVNIDFIVTF